MKYKNQNQNINQEPNTLSQADKLAIIASLISTFGGGLGTIATLVAIQEEQQNKEQSKQTNGNNDYVISELNKIKKQVNALEVELKQIKKMLSRLT
ncbi:hypothetical protein [Ureibacillus manganicus]|uniref:Translation initiation factor 2 n=1 Tax=Ureibacillus manganicus DSM 26584 TaxID=1384049 RepID=A0A0A3IV47_9BACL|nr:hypothetical protein [Ureibacillus manganicus]KGR78707.1 hypothetical protein CD29_10035 [Ureibacillus manganicus DSM 26584]